MAYTVILDNPAQKALSKLPTEAQNRILIALAMLRDNPRPPNGIKLSGNAELYRIRVGDYRILYQIEDKRLIVLVVRIGNRKDVYK